VPMRGLWQYNGNIQLRRHLSPRTDRRTLPRWITGLPPMRVNLGRQYTTIPKSDRLLASERRAVVVLASGRSGSSLLMQILSALGMRLSDELIEGREENPDGFFEDARIVRLQANLLRSLHAWPFHPLPADWLDAPATAAAFHELQVELRARLHQADGTWGFKDPRTTSFLPLWQRLFAAEKAMPAYVLALREPGSVIQSFMRAYDTPPEIAELVWLSRTCDALRHTAADCYIVHYEDWFTRPNELAEGLAQYTGLAEASRGNIAELLQPIIKPKLDRSLRSGYAIRNEHALRLHAALKDCRGSEFDRSRLMQTVTASLEALDGHRGWNRAQDEEAS